MIQQINIRDFIASLELFNRSMLTGIVSGAVVFVIGYLLVRLVSVLVVKAAGKKLSRQSAMIVRKGTYYSGMFLVLIIALHQFGIKLPALLGAAGIFGIALGFASQTSVSNIISGLFLIGEKPFEVGDIIKIADTKGTVLSIDLLSIKLRTFDNQFIRIPNENIIKTGVVNITRFPIRRMDIRLGVAYKENIRSVLALLKDIAEKNPYILDEPEPFIMFDSFGESALEINYGVWFARDDWTKAKTEIMLDIKERFDAEGIEIPFPHRTVYAGSATTPLPVRILGENEPGDGIERLPGK
jgi:small-conductance mechanosensitive channel